MWCIRILKDLLSNLFSFTVHPILVLLAALIGILIGYSHKYNKSDSRANRHSPSRLLQKANVLSVSPLNNYRSIRKKVLGWKQCSRTQTIVRKHSISWKKEICCSYVWTYICIFITRGLKHIYRKRAQFWSRLQREKRIS